MEVPQTLISRAVRAAHATLNDTYYTSGGVLKTKRPKDKQIEAVRLDVLVEVLDRDFRWYGEWGMTSHAIKMHLFDMAKENGNG